jgi:hypothetical protein
VILFNRNEMSTSRTREIPAIPIVSQAIGALAVGALAVGRLAIGRARIRQLEVDELVVRRLRVTEKLQVPPTSSGAESWKPVGRVVSSIETQLKDVYAKRRRGNPADGFHLDGRKQGR